MRSLRVDFQAEGCRLVLDEVVDGFDAVVQNSLVNLATAKGSADGDPSRGTHLLRDALRGRVVDLLTARHISNLASLDTVFFVRASDPPETSEERLEKLTLQPFEYDGRALRISAVAEGTLGSVRGVSVSI